MPSRCGCASDVCACHIVAGPNVSVTGTGTRDNPFVVSAATTVVTSEGAPAAPTSGDPHFTGQVIEYAGDTPPSPDYTLCDNKELSRTVYAQLFARIGTKYGAGNGTTTLNVPGQTDRVVIGASATRPAGTKGGAETTTLTADMLPPHAHTINHTHSSFTTASGGDHVHQFAQTSSNTDGIGNVVKRDGSNTDAVPVSASGAHTHTIAVPAYSGNSGNGPGASNPVSVMQPSIAMPKYIRIQGGP